MVAVVSADPLRRCLGADGADPHGGWRPFLAFRTTEDCSAVAFFFGARTFFPTSGRWSSFHSPSTRRARLSSIVSYSSFQRPSTENAAEAWPDTRAIIMEPQARELGFAWFQEENGKIWWTMVTGA